MTRFVLVVLLIVPIMANSQDSSKATQSNGSMAEAVQPPVAKMIHTEKTVTGKTLTDEYAGLRERSNPDVKAYLEAENAYAEWVMKPTQERQKKLYDEIISH